MRKSILSEKLWTFQHDREVVAAVEIIIDFPFIVHVAYGIA